MLPTTKSHRETKAAKFTTRDSGNTMVNSSSPLSYYRQIESQAPERQIATKEEFEQVLDTLDEMEEKYQTYLKTHSTIVRFFLDLCGWRSTHGSYQSALHALAGRLAAGYEDKLITLGYCEDLLMNPLHHNFCSKALDQVISNIYHQKAEKGFVWKIVNLQGVSNYLVGTIHLGTSDMGKVKGVREAIDRAEEVYTEVGLARTNDLRLLNDHPVRLPFLFCLDAYITRNAYEKGKKIYSLDNIELRKRVAMETKTGEECLFSHTIKECPDSKYFGVKDYVKVEPEKKSENYIGFYEYLSSIESTRNWKRGNETDSEIHEATRIYCDERTKAWLSHSYDSLDSTKPLPGLIDRIQSAAKPICIAVGLRHCIGSEVSLVDEFQKAGFAVSRIE